MDTREQAHIRWRQRQQAVERYAAVQGWRDLLGSPVALCPVCGDVVPQRRLTVAHGLVVCRRCAQREGAA